MIVNRIKIQDVILLKWPKTYPFLRKWEVISKDNKLRLGFIYQLDSLAIKRKIGYREFRYKYWTFERFHKPTIGIAFTRHEIIERLKESFGIEMK